MDALEYVNTHVEAWLEDWAAVTFRPKQYFRSGLKSGVTAFEFVIGTELLAYVACLLTSIAFFALFYWSNLVAHIRTTSTENVLAVSKLFIAVSISSFVALLVSTVISFAVARLLGSTASITAHVAAYFHLVALDPLAIAGASLVLLANAESWVSVIGSAIFILTRGWLLFAGYYATIFVHPLRPLKRAILLTLGYLPAFLVLNVIVVAVAAFIAMFAIAGWD